MKKLIKANFLVIFGMILLISCGEDDYTPFKTKNEALQNVGSQAEIEAVKLSWDLPSEEVQDYIIRYNPGEVYLTTDDGNLTEYTVEGLTPDTEYTFNISWLNKELITSEIATTSSTPLVRPPGTFTENLVFGNQSELNEFTLPGEAALVVIEGDLIIESDGSDNIYDISVLENLQTIEGNLIIRNNPILSNLEALGSLEIIIGGEVTLQNNRNLVNFCGLQNVTSSVNATIDSNGFNPTFQEILDGDCQTPDLVYNGFPRFNTQAEVDALPNGITHFPDELVIGLDASTNDITDLSKFKSLRRIEGRFIMQRTPLITDMNGFTALEFIGATDSDELVIRQMEGILTLDGLQALTHVGRRVGIRENPNLQSLDGLDNLRFIGENNIAIGVCGNESAANPLLTDYCALQGLIDTVGIEALEQGGSCIDSYSSFNPSFQDVLDGNCSL